ncbi:MAG: methyltransferase [Campylobacterota bacterium]|nr:methyltransferase [Campylobacterota bacterium]
MQIEENNQSKVSREFSRFAHLYNTYNIIQSDVARILVESLLKEEYKTIIDLGCGSGKVYENLVKEKIPFDSFLAVDISDKMLNIHPSDDSVQKIVANFNNNKEMKKLKYHTEETLLISASALQWADDLDSVFSSISTISSKSYFAIFTSNTFKTLHDIAEVKSPIHTPASLIKSISKVYTAKMYTKEYRLEFNSVKEMFHYIKKSGVSGGNKKLGYKQLKRVMETYPLKYLEFEVLFVENASPKVK